MSQEFKESSNRKPNQFYKIIGLICFFISLFLLISFIVLIILDSYYPKECGDLMDGGICSTILGLMIWVATIGFILGLIYLVHIIFLSRRTKRSTRPRRTDRISIIVTTILVIGIVFWILYQFLKRQYYN